jgi:predicted nucleotidyltransferase
MDMGLIDHIDKQFPFDKEDIVCLFEGGSKLHGARLHGVSDTDIYGVFIEPPSYVLGVQKFEHFITSDNETANDPSDVDITLYGLRNWAHLVMKGNPNVIYFLYAKNQALSTRLWDFYIRSMREELLTKKLIKQYLGFADAQRMRLTGERGLGRHGQRPDLVEKYGYDTKFAMHYIRLLVECEELLETRTISFPNPKKQLLLDIRQGKYSLNGVFELGNDMDDRCSTLKNRCNLPEAPEAYRLSERIAHVYRTHWKLKGRGIYD